MELVLEEDSPLASYLEGKGTSLTEDFDASRLSPIPAPAFSFAPPRQLLSNRWQSKTLLPAPQHWFKKLTSNVQDGYARAVSSTLGKADNERFLEHFRYIIIASQMLNEHIGVFSKSNGSLEGSNFAAHPESGTVLGALIATCLAFGFVWLVHWTRDAPSSNLRMTRMIVAGVLQALVALLLYAYVRRHWLKFLRSQAVEAATKFVDETQHFEFSTTSVLKQIQEIEIVSRGYQISSPLPPVSRLEMGEKPRTCHRLRHHLHSVYTNAIPAFLDAIETLRHHITEDDFEKFLDIYDIQAGDPRSDDAFSAELTGDEQESLSRLRELQYRFSTLRRLMLCSLLSIPATGRKEDRLRWRTSVAQMTSLGVLLGDLGRTIDKIVLEEDNLPPPSPMMGNTRPSSSGYNPNLVAYVLQLRTLHAKLHVVRTDVGRLTAASSVGLLDPASRDEFDAVGAGLRALLQTWEQGRAALNDVLVDKQKQFSLNVGGLGIDLRSAGDAPGTPDETPGLLNRGLPASPPLSAHSGSGDEIQFLRTNARTPQSDSEILFEAVSIPRQRPVLTREQRIVKMHEDREKVTRMKEKREASTNMIKELQAVIHLRPSAYRLNSARQDTIT